MGPICTWLFLYSEYLFILDSTEYERFLPMSWILEFFVVYLLCVYIYMFGWFCRAPIVLLYQLRCVVYHMLSKTRRNSRSLHSDRVYLLYLVSTLMLGVSHAVELLVLGLLVVVYSKIPYSSCVFNTVVVVACVIFIHWLVVFSKIYPELFPASPGAQLQEITVSTFSSQLGYLPRSDRKIYSVVYICSIRSEIAIVFDPVGSKKCWRWFPATTAPGEAGNSSRQILEKSPCRSEARKTNFQFFGANAHANVLKCTFSTDCKSNCVRIGLMCKIRRAKIWLRIRWPKYSDFGPKNLTIGPIGFAHWKMASDFNQVKI